MLSGSCVHNDKLLQRVVWSKFDNKLSKQQVFSLTVNGTLKELLAGVDMT